MFDLIGFSVTDLAKIRAFCVTALAPLKIGVVVDPPEAVAFGTSVQAQFRLGTRGAPPSGVHVAFIAVNRAEVRAFRRVALGAGGTDNGAHGRQPQHHPNDDNAFVLDPDGHNVEAVCGNLED